MVNLRMRGIRLTQVKRPGSGLVGQTPWSARDALVPLPEAEPGASARLRLPQYVRRVQERNGTRTKVTPVSVWVAVRQRIVTNISIEVETLGSPHSMPSAR